MPYIQDIWQNEIAALSDLIRKAVTQFVPNISTSVASLCVCSSCSLNYVFAVKQNLNIPDSLHVHQPSVCLFVYLFYCLRKICVTSTGPGERWWGTTSREMWLHLASSIRVSQTLQRFSRTSIAILLFFLIVALFALNPCLFVETAKTFLWRNQTHPRLPMSWHSSPKHSFTRMLD